MRLPNLHDNLGADTSHHCAVCAVSRSALHSTSDEHVHVSQHACSMVSSVHKRLSNLFVIALVTFSQMILVWLEMILNAPVTLVESRNLNISVHSQPAI